MSRQVVVAGHIGPDGHRWAYLCAWCGEWQTAGGEEAMRQGARVSHTMCRRCYSEWMRERDERPPAA